LLRSIEESIDQLEDRYNFKSNRLTRKILLEYPARKMRRATDGGGLKGVTLVRGGKSYALSLPKFTPPPNANSINVDRDDLHERFKKLSPKQRIAVLTVRDPNVASKLYAYSNKLWYHQIQSMRTSVGNKDEEEVLSRSFFNSFEFLFGDSEDDNDSDHEDSKPLLGKQATSKSSPVVTSRPINSTFSYSKSVATVFKPKLNFISTKDVLKVFIDGSKDFCNSKVRTRCRVLQRPEMWDRVVDIKESVSGPEYESLIYQLMEFRVIYEYLNGGAGGEPFLNIRKRYPTEADRWVSQEKALTEMEEGSCASTTPATPVVSEEQATPLSGPAGPKKTRKKRLLEKIALTLTELPASNEQTFATKESDTTDTDEDEIIQPISSATDVLPPISAPIVLSEGDDADWIEVGASAKLKKREPLSAIYFGEASKTPVSLARYTLSDEHLNHVFKDWKWCSVQGVYMTIERKVVYRRTFLDVVSRNQDQGISRESPF
jgi:hypothetical protein